MMTTSRLIALFAATIILFLAVPAAFAEEPPLEVTVKPGDTLNELCKQYLQDPGRCMEVARINQLKNPDRIEPGEKIVIPSAMLKAKPAQPITGTVTFLSGDVLVQTENSIPWRLAALNDRVFSGDRIRTGRNGSVELAFDDGSFFLLRAETEIDIGTLSRQDSGYLKNFFLGIGRLLARTLKGGSLPSRTEIRTATAIAGIKGTRFSLSVREDQTTQAVVHEGSIGVSAMGKDVEVQAGEGTSVKMGMPPETPKKLLPPSAPVDLRPEYAAMPVIVKLSPVEGAHRYSAALTRDREGRDIVTEQQLSPGEPFQATGLESGSYYLHTRSIDAGGIEGLEGEPALILVRIERTQPAVQPAQEAPRPEEWSTIETLLILIMAIAAMTL